MKQRSAIGICRFALRYRRMFRMAMSNSHGSQYPIFVVYLFLPFSLTPFLGTMNSYCKWFKVEPAFCIGSSFRPSKSGSWFLQLVAPKKLPWSSHVPVVVVVSIFVVVEAWSFAPKAHPELPSRRRSTTNLWRRLLPVAPWGLSVETWSGWKSTMNQKKRY